MSKTDILFYIFLIVFPIVSILGIWTYNQVSANRARQECIEVMRNNKLGSVEREAVAWDLCMRVKGF